MLEERKEYIQQQIDSLGEKIICLEAEMKMQQGEGSIIGEGGNQTNTQEIPQEQMSLEEMYKKIFGEDYNDDVVPASQGYGNKTNAEYEQQTQKAIEESVRQLPRGGPIIRDRGEQSKRGKEKVIEVSSDSD
uniref:Uncharacterized protein n=1 Tax=Meloidogyne floridensis TaxID=298350 RepID=A0A915NXB6_9BILA